MQVDDWLCTLLVLSCIEYDIARGTNREAVSLVKSRHNEGTDQEFSSMLCQARQAFVNLEK